MCGSVSSSQEFTITGLHLSVKIATKPIDVYSGFNRSLSEVFERLVPTPKTFLTSYKYSFYFFKSYLVFEVMHLIHDVV